MEVPDARRFTPIAGPRRDWPAADMDRSDDQTGPEPLRIEEYPAYPEGTGMAIGSVSEEAPGTACGTGCHQTGATLAPEGRENWLGDPMEVAGDPAEIGEPFAAEPVPPPITPRSPVPPAEPAPDCAAAACQGSVRAKDLTVLDVSTGQTWPALGPPRR